MNADIRAAYVEYVAMLAAYAAEDVAETKADDRDAADWSASCRAMVQAESNFFETDGESRLEMEADDMRCGGSFSELLHEGLAS
jgi:hypothetical protein